MKPSPATMCNGRRSMAKCKHEWIDWHYGPMAVGRKFWECNKCGARSYAETKPPTDIVATVEILERTEDGFTAIFGRKD